MKVIDLIVDITNKKPLPKKIKIEDYTFELDEEETNVETIYQDGYNYWLRNPDKYDISLYDEVEIIEEPKKIEKLKLYAPYPECEETRFDDIQDKINEIIDYINKENK